MSVIGRLDKQVEDVFISPLSKTRETPDKVPSVEQPQSERSNDERRTETTPENQPTREKSPLPVWLL